jgi:hypothetical protein
MSKIKINTVGLSKRDISTLLNPAVLGVTELKNETAILPPRLLCSERVLLYSRKKYATHPSSNKAIVV